MIRKSSFSEFLYSSTRSIISKYKTLDNDWVHTGKYLNVYTVLFFFYIDRSCIGKETNRTLHVADFQQIVSIMIIFSN